jgi:hypothetical protein
MREWQIRISNVLQPWCIALAKKLDPATYHWAAAEITRQQTKNEYGKPGELPWGGGPPPEPVQDILEEMRRYRIAHAASFGDPGAQSRHTEPDLELLDQIQRIIRATVRDELAEFEIDRQCNAT